MSPQLEYQRICHSPIDWWHIYSYIYIYIYLESVLVQSMVSIGFLDFRTFFSHFSPLIREHFSTYEAIPGTVALLASPNWFQLTVVVTPQTLWLKKTDLKHSWLHSFPLMILKQLLDNKYIHFSNFKAAWCFGLTIDLLWEKLKHFDRRTFQAFFGTWENCLCGKNLADLNSTEESLEDWLKNGIHSLPGCCLKQLDGGPRRPGYRLYWGSWGNHPSKDSRDGLTA